MGGNVRYTKVGKKIIMGGKNTSNGVGKKHIMGGKETYNEKERIIYWV